MKYYEIMRDKYLMAKYPDRYEKVIIDMATVA